MEKFWFGKKFDKQNFEESDLTYEKHERHSKWKILISY